MTNPIRTSLVEEQSTNKPPHFNGTNYIYQKARMRIFIQAQDYDMWNAIIRGPHTLTMIVDGMFIPKFKKDWDKYDKKQTQLNAKAMNVLYCALDANEFNRISTCLYVKKI